jgi:hypothetical protein
MRVYGGEYTPPNPSVNAFWEVDPEWRVVCSLGCKNEQHAPAGVPPTVLPGVVGHEPKYVGLGGGQREIA